MRHVRFPTRTRESPLIVTHFHAMTLVNHGADETPSAGLWKSALAKALKVTLEEAIAREAE